MPEALIIGAGPAGSTAAILLARAGWMVQLVEQHRFPRDKVCGECLSSTAFDVLTRLGLHEKFKSLNALRLTRTVLRSADGESASLALPKPMWGLSRACLDHFLQSEAKRAGATILQPARCESLTPGARPSARIRVLEKNEILELAPSLILLADGKGALLPNRPATTEDFGIKTHFEHVNGPRDAIEMFGVGDHYGGLAPIEGDRTNAAFSVPARLVAEAKGDIDALFGGLSRRSTALRIRLAGARRCGPWLAAPLPRFQVASTWPAGIIPLGNSAAALEPVGGEGIGLAMRSAELAVASILANDFLQLPAAMKRLWRVRSASCRAIARLLSSPQWSGPSLGIARDCPFAAPLAMRLMGKG